MADYKAPLRDMRFVLNEFMDPARLRALPGCEEMTDDLVDPILEEAGKLCAEVLFPINRPGDEEGCTIENGVVRTPKGFDWTVHKPLQHEIEQVQAELGTQGRVLVRPSGTEPLLRIMVESSDAQRSLALAQRMVETLPRT
jgi:phosphomannomutase